MIGLLSGFPQAAVLFATAALLLALPACRKEQKPAPAEPAAPSSAFAVDPLPSGAQESLVEPAKVAANAPTRESLREVFDAVWCITKRRDRSGLNAVYEAHGLKGSADFAAAWAALRQSDPKWVEETMARVGTLDCPVAGQ